MFSVSDIYLRLKTYRQSLLEKHLAVPRLYFVKLDVQNCFDTVPQEKLLHILSTMLTADAYHVDRMARVQPSDLGLEQAPRVRYSAVAHPVGSMLDLKATTGQKDSRTTSKSIVIPGIGQQTIRKSRAMHLLCEHVKQNTVRIGKRFYQQKVGIPQGSILSALLCNFLYGKLEQDRLSQTLGKDGLLLRLIDDFLFITPDKIAAERFVQTLYDGIPEYGVNIKLEKSLLNFAMKNVPCHENFLFPYCGLHIDIRDLSISKPVSGLDHQTIANSLSITFTAEGERIMRQKTINAFRLHLHAMFLDSSLNSVSTILRNLYLSYRRAALRCLHHWRGLARYRRIDGQILVDILEDLEATALSIVQRRDNKKSQFQCSLHPGQNRWVALRAFFDVLKTHQSRHKAAISWIQKEMSTIRPRSGMNGNALQTLVHDLEIAEL